jgi:hypothetical protein
MNRKLHDIMEGTLDLVTPGSSALLKYLAIDLTQTHTA